MAGAKNLVLKTKDGGTTWSSLSVGADYNLTSVFFPDRNMGYAVGGDGAIFKTGRFRIGNKRQFTPKWNLFRQTDQ